MRQLNAIAFYQLADVTEGKCFDHQYDNEHRRSQARPDSRKEQQINRRQTQAQANC